MQIPAWLAAASVPAAARFAGTVASGFGTLLRSALEGDTGAAPPSGLNEGSHQVTYSEQEGWLVRQGDSGWRKVDEETATRLSALLGTADSSGPVSISVTDGHIAVGTDAAPASWESIFSALAG